MDAHEREGKAAAAAMVETYGVTGGTYRDGRCRWKEDDCVMFWHGGDLCRGHIMEVIEGVKRDTYRIRRHVEGGGSEVVEVNDLALLPY